MMGHGCLPRWECCIDGEGEWHDVYARGAKEAAEKFADWSCARWGEYNDCDVVVRDVAEHQVRYLVMLSMVPEFSADLIEEGER